LLQSDTQLNYSLRIKERKERINNITDEDEEKMGDRQGDRCVTNRKKIKRYRRNGVREITVLMYVISSQ
jgi:hypothetical protein